MRKVALHTLGCKLNFAETATLVRGFLERGFDVVGFDQPSDVYVLNTCSVTARADSECRQLIRRAIRLSPDAFVVVTGCYAQLRPQEVAAIEGVDLVLGNSEKPRLFDLAKNFTKNPLPQAFVSCIDEAEDFSPAFSADFSGRTRAFLKIQDGCDFGCSFCTIPLARGVSRSQTPDAVLNEARHLASQGFREIVLTGVNVGDYGKKIGSSLAELIDALEPVRGIDRIRVSSIEPNLLSRSIVDKMLGSEKFCNHFHVPLQSGSDTILRAMRRRYLTDHYRDIIEYIHRQDPEAGIGADVLAGFPGETDEIFGETVRFLEDLPISYIHAFTYSERPNTSASLSRDQIEPRVRFARTARLRELSRRKRREFHQKFLGRRLPVLLESTVRRGHLTGLTTNYIRVETPADLSLVNTIQNVTITGADEATCFSSKISALPPESIVQN